MGLVPPSTQGWRNFPLSCDRRTSGPGHGHSLWQITRSQLRLVDHMEDPCWDWVLCNPSLTRLACALLPIIPLSFYCMLYIPWSYRRPKGPGWNLCRPLASCWDDLSPGKVKGIQTMTERKLATDGDTTRTLGSSTVCWPQMTIKEKVSPTINQKHVKTITTTKVSRCRINQYCSLGLRLWD